MTWSYQAGFSTRCGQQYVSILRSLDCGLYSLRPHSGMFNLKRFTYRGKRREIAGKFSSKIDEIIRSQLFNVGEVIVSKHRVNLSQACVLLWRDWFTGDVDGLWTNSSRLAAAYACILLELIALGKISCKLHDVFGKTAIKVKVNLMFRMIFRANIQLTSVADQLLPKI